MEMGSIKNSFIEKRVKHITEYTIKDIDLEAAKNLNREICDKYNFIPIKEEEDKIIVLTYEKNKESTDYLEFLYTKKIVIKEIERDNYEKLKNIIFSEEEKDLGKILIFNAIEQNASDIHFEPMNESVIVRYRINGSLALVYKMNREEYIKLSSKIKLNADMDITEKRRPQDGKIIINYHNNKYDLRVSSIPVIYGEKIVIRILYCDNFYHNFDDLGFSEEEIKLIRKIISLNNGLVIVAGPTGAGKSTTLYTMLKEIDSKTMNITTLEDPVEVSMPNINQMNLNKKIGLDFSTGLRSILRQDPDVIMIGEIRDEETADMAVRAAITGHKVYSTIHCKSAREVYLRLENMGVKPYLIRDALAGIVSQRLVKILCRKCKEKDLKNSFNGRTLYKKCGCKECNYSGYEGRQIVSAVYYIQEKDQKSIEELYEDSEYLSNENMKKDLEKLLTDGLICYADYIDFINGEGINN